MKTNIKKLDSNDLHKYDDLVSNSIEGTLFHKSWWLNTLKKYYGESYNVDFYGAFEGENLISGIPIPVHSKFGMNLIYNPKLTPYLGPFHRERDENIKKYGEKTRKKKINEDLAEILNNAKNCMIYMFNYHTIDMQPFIWNNFDINVHYTYILNLDDLNKVWNDIDKSRRHDINKCCKQGYNIEFDKVEDFIELNKKTMERQGLEVISKELWSTIFNGCKEHDCCKVFTIYKNKDAIASLFLVWDNKRSYYLSGGINNNSEGTMSLLMWEAIKYTKEKLGLNEFDFEGSDDMGVELFFRKFGGDIKPFYSISKKSMKVALAMRLYYKFKFSKFYWMISGK